MLTITDERSAPTPTILDLCFALEEVLAGIGEERSSLTVGAYEADVEASLMFSLGMRQVEGVIHLARSDLRFLPAAVQVARAAFEACVRAAWLVDEDDPFNREARYIAHLKGETSYLRRSAERLETIGMDTAATRERADGIDRFGNNVSGALSRRGVSPQRLPKFDKMLEMIGGQALYALYMEASQFAHAGHAATWLYRSGLGIHKEIRESISPQQWRLPLQLSWLALSQPGHILLTRLGRRATRFPSAHLRERFRDALGDLAGGSTRLLH